MVVVECGISTIALIPLNDIVIMPFLSDNYVVTGGWCVRTCSTGMFEVEENGVQQCQECNGPCPRGTDKLIICSGRSYFKVRD